MSVLADQTEQKALTIIARMVKDFEKLYYLNMSKADDADACKARNLLHSIIESNGYQVNYDRNIPRSIIKLK